MTYLPPEKSSHMLSESLMVTNPAESAVAVHNEVGVMGPFQALSPSDCVWTSGSDQVVHSQTVGQPNVRWAAVPARLKIRH